MAYIICNDKKHVEMQIYYYNLK